MALGQHGPVPTASPVTGWFTRERATGDHSAMSRFGTQHSQAIAAYAVSKEKSTSPSPDGAGVDRALTRSITPARMREKLRIIQRRCSANRRATTIRRAVQVVNSMARSAA